MADYCIICRKKDGPPRPIQSGCACGGFLGYAHVACKAACATELGQGFHHGWNWCPTCEQKYTGAMQLGMAKALWVHVRSLPAGNDDRLRALNSLATAYTMEHRFGEAEALWRGLLKTRIDVNGPDHEDTLVVAGNLGNMLKNMGRHNEAEDLLCETLERKQEVNGPTGHSTLLTAGFLAEALQRNGKSSDALPLMRHTILNLKDKDDATTLYFTNWLAEMLDTLGQHNEATTVATDASARANDKLGKNHTISRQLARTCDALRDRNEIRDRNEMTRQTATSGLGFSRPAAEVSYSRGPPRLTCSPPTQWIFWEHITVTLPDL